MSRFVVLQDQLGYRLPIGVAVERGSGVVVVALDEYALPKLITEPYSVVGRDLVPIEYVPGDDGYFDQVIFEISRVAAVAARGEIDEPSAENILELFNERVQKVRLAAPQGYKTEHTTRGRGQVWKSASTTVETQAAPQTEPVPRVAA